MDDRGGTTQGGPPNGDRKRGTGEGLALRELKVPLWSKVTMKRLGGERKARLLDGAGEPCGRM